MRQVRFLIVVAFFPGALQPLPAEADEFALVNGGHVSGELLNSNQLPRADYVVRTTEGVILKIERSQVAQTDRQRPQLAEYERIWPRFADTVEAQWKIAEWCRENRLLEQREHHLARIIHLDRDHESARRALGYVRRGGRWTTSDDEFRSQGYIQHEGRWRTVQEIQLIEEERARTETANGWLRKLKTYRDQLASGKGAGEAHRAILEIDDPAAIEALRKALAEESSPRVRELYLDALGNLDTAEAALLLAAVSMQEPVAELRYTCLDHLKGKYVAIDFFIRLLGSAKNDVVNRAAGALGYLEARSAVGPLIRSLVTTHKETVRRGNGGQTSAGFGSGGTGFSTGGSDEIIKAPKRNGDVWAALVELTGQDFGFDQVRWKNWHARHRRYEHVNPRRD